MDALELLLNNILKTQQEMNTKMDGLQTLLQCTETRIMDSSEKKFLKIQDFPHHWNAEMKRFEKTRMDIVERRTRIVELAIKWGGWILAIGGFIISLIKSGYLQL